MRALLQKSCKTCTSSSIETYYYTIRGLAKLVGLEEIPLDHKWINDKLFERVKLQAKTTSSKNLAVAALKAGSKSGSCVSKVSEKYSQVRNKQERTKRESKNWPKGGYDDIRKLAERLRKEDVVQRALQKAPARITFTELWYLGRWLTFTFYSRHALRGDLADLQIKKKGANYLYKGRGGKWHVHVGEHKTAKSHGAIDIPLHDDVHKALNLVLPYVRAKTTHGYLLSTKRYGNRMRRVDMMKMLRNTTEQYLGKRGIQMLRVMKTTSHLKELDEGARLRQEMGHSASMQFKYVSRPK